MYLPLVAALLAAVPVLAVAQTVPQNQPLPNCTSASDCPLIDFTQRALGAGLAGVTLAPGEARGMLLGRTGDSALPLFRLMWIDQTPPMSPDRTAAEFMRGLHRPNRFCNRRPIPAGASADGTQGAFDIRCSGGQTPEVQVVLHAVQDAQRTRTLVLLAPLGNGPALLARGQRVLTAIAAPPRDYAQLRQDCADDSDAPRQIAGCNAVLANPSETGNYGIALSNRGHARERTGDLASALADYERAIAQEPGNITAQINRARILARLSRAEEALAVYDRIIQAGDNGWARLERGRLLASRNEGERAVADLEAAVRLLPGDEEALTARDWARFRRSQGLGFDEVQPEATTLADAVLNAEGFFGMLSVADAARIRRDKPSQASAEWESMPSDGGPGRYEVEARSCAEVVVEEVGQRNGRRQVLQRRVIDLNRLRGLLSRDGDAFVYRAGVYGERIVETPRGTLQVPIAAELRQFGPSDNRFAQALVYLDAIKRFCPGAAPQAAPAPAAAAAPTAAQPSAPQAPAANTGRFTGQPATPAPSAQAAPAFVAPAPPGSAPPPAPAPNTGRFTGQPATPAPSAQAAPALVVPAPQAPAAPPAPAPNTGRFTGQPAAAAPSAPAAPPAPPAAGTSAPPAAANPTGDVQIRTVRGLMRDKPYSLSFPDEFQQSADPSAELFLDHSSALFQVTLKMGPATAGASAQTAARRPAAEVTAADRAAFADFSLEQRSVVMLPAGPAHVYVATMTSPMGDRPRLRMVVAELFSEGRRYELAFTVGEDVFASAGNAIGFILANFSPTSAPRTCCASPVSLPW